MSFLDLQELSDFLPAYREPLDCSQVDYSTGFPVPLGYYTGDYSKAKGLWSRQQDGVEDDRKERDESDLARRCAILSVKHEFFSCLLLRHIAYHSQDIVNAQNK